jgi:hypothetical protein
MRLWHGISNSPIIFVRSGYSLGALMIVFISKSFVKFNPILSSKNETSIIESTDIKLKLPYSIAGIFSIFIGFIFILIQYFEYKENIRQQVNLNNKKNINTARSVLDKISFIIFNDNKYKRKKFNSKILLTILLLIVTISIGGFTIVLSNFMISYVTKGPAKLSIEIFFKIQTLFWIFMTVGRLLAAIIAFRLNTLVYVFSLISLNFTFILLYSIPNFNSKQIFYWLITIPLGIVVGPIVPSTVMLTKHVMKNLSSFLISVCGIGGAIGAIMGQFITGYLLDEFKPKSDWLQYTDATSAYIIPFVALIGVTIALTFYLILIFFKRKFETFLE